MSEFLSPILYQLSVGGIGGFFIGYLIKKTLKLALIIGAFVLAFSYFAYDDVIQVNYAQLLVRVQESVTPVWESVSPFFSKIPFSGSFIMGVVTGFIMS